MGPKQIYPTRNYGIGQHLLTLRSRAKLTQAELASRLGIHRRSVQKWESGETCPTAENLRALIAVLLILNVFSQGQEQDEAATLWQQVSEAAPQPFPPFNSAWLHGLLADRTAARSLPPSSAPLTVERPRSRTNPTFILPLIGREAELAEIASILNNPACRLLTLFGPGGIGKTRLALTVVTAQTEQFRDGAIFVSLVSASAPNQLVSAIGEALNLSFAGQPDPVAHLLHYLRERQLLLALDGFEGLLADPASVAPDTEAADLVYDILRHAPAVTLLVTSRTRLNLQAEWLFEVEGLAYPPVSAPAWSATSSLEPLAEVMTVNDAAAAYGAVQLFVQRARQVQPGFPLPETTLAAIVRICQHVAGMPLAIELAAAGIRLLPVTEIERQIRSNLDAFATPWRDVPERHRSLRAVFDQSWALLNTAEQRLFSRLAIFHSGCTAAAAEQVAGATMPALVALVDKSLVRQTVGEIRPGGGYSSANTATDRRFTMLAPIRDYALEKLAARGEMEALQRAHARYFLGLAEAAEAQPVNPVPDLSVEQLDREQDNLRSALQWTCDGGDLTLGLRLAGALRWFWRRRGYISEGRLWLETLLAIEADDPDTTAMAARLRALEGAAWLASHQHDYARAAQLFEQGMMLRWALGEPKGETNLLANAALEARAAGNYERATMLLEDAVARGRALDDQRSLSNGGLGLWLFLLGLVSREQGDFSRAAALFEEAVALHRALGDREGIAIGLLALSDIPRDQGNIARIQAICAESLALFRELEVQWAIGFALNNLALGAYRAGDLPQALAFINESVALFRAQKADGSLAEVLVTLGQILQAQGEEALASQALTEALHLAWTVGPRLMGAAALEALAGVVISRQQTERAAYLLASAAALRSQMGTPVRPADQPALEQTLAATRLALDAHTFAGLWETGKELAFEQILNHLPDPAEFSASVAPAGLSLAAPLAGQPTVETPSDLLLATLPRSRIDWGLAQDVPALYGRRDELATLTGWALAEGRRVITLVGLGGIGKTSLALTFARQVAPHFEAVIFRSLGEAPPLPELLDGLIRHIAPRQLTPPPRTVDKLALLIELLQACRCLLILDNLETLMQTGKAGYLAGYEDYGTLFKTLGETAHQSCLILTSRERLPELAPLEGPHTPVRTLRLAGLPEAACRMLLADQALTGTIGDMAALARRYSGNPLALKLVAEPVRALFSGDIAAFLTEGSLFFEGVGRLLEQQLNRASALEQTLLTWLAIGREPVELGQLIENLAEFPSSKGRAGGASRAGVLAALHALWRRNLIERGQENLTFTLQRVVLEYLTERLVEQAAEEVKQGSFDRLRRYALIQATAKEYIRRSQERLIATPLLEHLAIVYGSAGAVEQQLLRLLDAWHDRPFVEQGYGPGNIINLLRLLRGHLRGLDLEGLAIWQANLQSLEVQDTRLAGAMIQNSIFTETFDAIQAVAASSTGEYWAAASRRGEVLIWTSEGQTLHRMWRAHTDMIWTLMFSPDGRTLATGSWDGRVKLWDVASGALLWSGQHTSHVNSVAFAPNRSLLASGGQDATVRLWDLQSGAQLQTLPHPGPVSGNGVTWSSDGALLASGDLEGCIRVWEIQEVGPAICIETIAAHSNIVDGLAFSPDGRTLASGGWDGTVKLWDISPLRSLASPQGSPDLGQTARRAGVSSGYPQQIITGHTGRVGRVAWSPDGRTLAVSGSDPMIWLWDVERGSYQTVLQGHTDGVCGLAFTPDNRSLLSCGDSTLRVWNMMSGQCIRVIRGYADFLNVIDWSPDGVQLVSGGMNRLVTIWDVTGATPPRALHGHNGAVCGVGWSPDGRWLASTEWENAIRLWDPASGACLRLLQHPDDTGNFFYGLTWSPDGQRLAGGTWRRGVQLFEVTSQPQGWVGREFPTFIRQVAWSPEGTQLAGGGDDGLVYVWDTADGATPRRLAGHHSRVTSLAWNPAGTRLASGGMGRENGELFVWDLQRGEHIQAITNHPRMVYAVAWGASEALVISGGGDGKLRWWDIQSGECVRVREAHQGTVQSLRRSPDGMKLASCGDDGAIALWDLHTGEHLQTLRRDRPYERLNITGIKGLTEAQRMALLALGAVET